MQLRNPPELIALQLFRPKEATGAEVLRTTYGVPRATLVATSRFDLGLDGFGRLGLEELISDTSAVFAANAGSELICYTAPRFGAGFAVQAVGDLVAVAVVSEDGWARARSALSNLEASEVAELLTARVREHFSAALETVRRSARAGERWDPPLENGDLLLEALEKYNEVDWQCIGIWASCEAEHNKPWPWPFENEGWEGQTEFLEMLSAVQAKTPSKRPWKPAPPCRLCEETLPSRQFEHRKAGVRWTEGLFHYVEQHNILPAEWFVEYIRGRRSLLDSTNRSRS